MSGLIAQWGPLLIVAAILWAGYKNLQIVHAANMDRRDDHKELMRVLEDIKQDVSNLEGAVDGLSRRYDPPDLSSYD